MRRLATRLQTDWPDIARSVRDSTSKMQEDLVKQKEATLAVAGAEDERRKAALAVQQQELTVEEGPRRQAEADLGVKDAQIKQEQAHANVIHSRLEIEKAGLSVRQAEYQLQVALGGGRDKDVEESLRIDAAREALAKASQASAGRCPHCVGQAAPQQEQKAALEYADALDRQKKVAIENQQAQIALNEARRGLAQAELGAEQKRLDLQTANKNIEDNRRKDLPALANQIARIEQGDRGAARGLELAEPENVFRATELRASQRQGGGEPTPVNQLLELSRLFQSLPDEFNATKQALLGRRVGQEVIQALNQGPQALQKQRSKRLLPIAEQLKQLIEGARRRISGRSGVG